MLTAILSDFWRSFFAPHFYVFSTIFSTSFLSSKATPDLQKWCSRWSKTTFFTKSRYTKKSSFGPPFWLPKIDPGPQNTSRLTLMFLYVFSLQNVIVALILSKMKIRTAGATQIRGTSMSQLSFFHSFFRFFMICWWFSCIAFLAPLREHFLLTLITPESLQIGTWPSKMLLSLK